MSGKVNKEIVLREGLKKVQEAIGKALNEVVLSYYQQEGYEKAIFRMKELLKDILEDIKERRDIRIAIDYSDLYGYTDSKERYNPKADPVSALQLYLLPYRYALKFIKDRDVLDVGCGYGYGCALLAKEAKSVVGIDYEPEVIRYARRHYKSKNCSFKRHDANECYPFEGESFDAVFLSNVLEQLERYEYSLSEMKRVLKDGGEIILKTRNGRHTTAEANPHHVVVFNEEELKELLEKYFEEVKVYGYNVHYSHQANPLINRKSRESNYEFGDLISLMYKYEIAGFLQAVMVDDPRKAGFLIAHGKTRKSARKEDSIKMREEDADG